MSEIIWGNVQKIISNQTIEINVTHQKNENRQDYSNVEKILIKSTDIPSLPINAELYTVEMLESYLANKFVKVEIHNRNESGVLEGIVSHSGQGGY